MENIEKDEIIILIEELRDRIKKYKMDAKISAEEIEQFLDKWKSWVIDNTLYKLGVDRSNTRELVDTIAKAIEKVKSPNEGESYLGVILFIALKNDFYKDMILDLYFPNE